MRGFPAALLVVGVLGLGWLICFGFVGFRFVHHRNRHLIFFHGPVAKVTFAASFTTERELRVRDGINDLLADGAFQLHAKPPVMYATKFSAPLRYLRAAAAPMVPCQQRP